MPTTKTSPLDQMNALSRKFTAYERRSKIVHAITDETLLAKRAELYREELALQAQVMETIQQFAPANSQFMRMMDEAYNHRMADGTALHLIIGILRGLRDAYANGYMRSIEELIHGDVFADFIEMAEHLVISKFPLPAAVLAGAVLEEHVRKLCDKHGVTLVDQKGAPKSVETMNQDLAKQGVYTKPVQMSVTAWYATRTSAAHNKPDFDPALVPSMIRDVRDFVGRFPA